MILFSAKASAKLAAVGYVAIIGLQIALVAGAPWGEFTQGGRLAGALDGQGRVSALFSAVVLAFMAMVMLARAGIGPLCRCNLRTLSALTWSTVAYSAVAVLLNSITPSAVERMVWVPIAVALLALNLNTALATRAKLRP